MDLQQTLCWGEGPTYTAKSAAGDKRLPAWLRRNKWKQKSKQWFAEELIDCRACSARSTRGSPPDSHGLDSPDDGTFSESLTSLIAGVSPILQFKLTLEGAGMHLRSAFGLATPPTSTPFLLRDDFRRVALVSDSSTTPTNDTQVASVCNGLIVFANLAWPDSALTGYRKGFKPREGP